jgi:hypothetical protein
MFALNLGIGYSDDLRPEYQVSGCLAGLDIRAVHWRSISRRRSTRQKTRTADVEGLASTSLGIVDASHTTLRATRKGDPSRSLNSQPRWWRRSGGGSPGTRASCPPALLLRPGTTAPAASAPPSSIPEALYPVQPSHLSLRIPPLPTKLRGAQSGVVMLLQNPSPPLSPLS